MPVVAVVPDWVAVAAVDPGGVTGVARGVFPVGSAGSIAEALAGATQLESWEEEGSVVDQAASIADELADWFGWMNMNGIAIPNLKFVIESFALRQRHADLSPIEIRHQLIARWDVMGWNGRVAAESQTPADAKSYATNARLRRWGGWVVGSPHRRDAMRHLLLKVNRIMNGA